MDVMAEHTESLETLARRAEAGERAAIEELLERFRGPLQTWIRLRLGEHLRAHVELDDVFQETVLRALRSMGGFQWRGERAFSNWLARIAENAIREQARGLARDQAAPLSDELPGEIVSPSRAQRRGERFERLRAALEGLDPVSRRVVELSRLEGRSLKDIAALVDRSPNAVALVLMRAQRRLRERLGDTESLGLPDRALPRVEPETDGTGSI